MLALPEGLHLAAQLNESAAHRTVNRVLPPSKAHKFCWYNGDPADYDAAVRGCQIESAESFGIFVELAFENGCRLCFNDGVNVRLLPTKGMPESHQLAVVLDNGRTLVFTVAMYGGIILHDGGYDNAYYAASRRALSPFSPAFPAYFQSELAACRPAMNAAAFLATQQRFCGVGNGVLQDILFAAGVHPKRKLGTLSRDERERLLACTVSVLREMAEQGGRDTEKDLFGTPGGYRVKLSKNTLAAGCPGCSVPIVKEAYLGGSVYDCPACQPLI